MSIGLAKTAESTESPKPIVHKDLPSTGSIPKEPPYDLYAMFNEDPFRIGEKDKSDLFEIYEYASNKVPVEYRTTGNIMIKISELKRNLGAPRLDETSWRKLHTFIKMSKAIDDLDKRREALRD